MEGPQYQKRNIISLAEGYTVGVVQLERGGNWGETCKDRQLRETPGRGRVASLKK